MSRILLIALLGSSLLWACQSPAQEQESPEKPSVVHETGKSDPKPQTSIKEKAVESEDFEAFRKLFSSEFPPYKLDPNSETPQDELSSKDQLAYLKRSVNARPVAEILFEDDQYVSLVTWENPLEDLKTFVWNLFDVEGELLAHRMVAGVEGTDSIYGEFFPEGKVVVETFYPAGKNDQGEALSGKREEVLQLGDGEILKEE